MCRGTKNAETHLFGPVPAFLSFILYYFVFYTILYFILFYSFLFIYDRLLNRNYLIILIFYCLCKDCIIYILI